jgi:hypothetical protein
LDYLFSNGFTESFNSLRNETQNTDFNPGPKQKSAGLLEKKWTSVIRLQKKVKASIQHYRKTILLQELWDQRLLVFNLGLITLRTLMSS